MTNAEWMPELLTKADKAFMVSFQETHNQY